MKQLTLYTLALFWVLLGCKNQKEDLYSKVSNLDTESKSPKTHPGKKLLENQCYVCHSPTAPEKEGRIGPPMIAIKAHYIKEGTTKEAFTEALWNFVEKPTMEKVKLKGAVKRFGLMPYQPFNKEDIEKIAEYLYDYQIEEPDWFKAHWENGKGKKRKPYNNKGKKTSDAMPKTPKDIGLHYALSTKKVLGKNLMGTIQKKGTEAALEFCNVKAYPLTDSMAKKHHATIKRVSDLPRNPLNKANTEELNKIKYFKKQIAVNAAIEPIVETKDGKNQFYYPITTNSMCLQCHGQPKTDIKENVLASIDKLYPKDLAKGYTVNELRGIWSITFNTTE